MEITSKSETSTNKGQIPMAQRSICVAAMDALTYVEVGFGYTVCWVNDGKPLKYSYERSSSGSSSFKVFTSVYAPKCLI